MLGDHPDQRRKVVEDRSLINNTIEELLRYEPPGPAIGRYLPEDVELYGQMVPAGSAMLFIVGARPTATRPASTTRTNSTSRDMGQHLTFGYGIHFCLGAALGARRPHRARRGAQPVPGVGGRHGSGHAGIDVDGARVGDASSLRAVTEAAPAPARRRYDNTLRRERAARDPGAQIAAAGAELLRSSSIRDWRALTVRGVAERAGVNERTVYRHFANERAVARRGHAALRGGGGG